ncbi:MAG: MarC family protein [Candidatus Omnitrophica bacterium]|nr:MarC family protein [Candidatus Omnitrophota bacterium]MBU4140389.1 MarC family protein [Candidatus Omnitrophota bacterium]
MFKNVFLAFIPLFVAVDAIGVLPIFVSLTEELDKKEKLKVIFQSITTAICLAIGFIFLGQAIFRFLNITVGDFMIAGGILLFCIAITDILNPVKKRRIPSKELGSVPLGTPLIVGPAVLTTSLIVMQQYGLAPTLIAVLANVLLAGVIFLFSHVAIKVLGEAGSRALSKIAALLLAAIAVMMVRRGILYFITSTI